MPRLALFLATLFVVTQASGVASDEAQFSPEQIEFFEMHVRPLLVERCYECHSGDARELKADLYVDSRQGLIQNDQSGPVVVPGKPEESPLIAAVRYESVEMPPDGKLTASEIAALTRWVEMGAPWPQITSIARVDHESNSKSKEIDWEKARASHWAWQPVVQPEVPSFASESPTHEIDRFVIARREEARLSSRSPARPAILVRRIFLDLVGVPPTPLQAQSFVAAAAENRQSAVVALVDELLESPLYGQRWARHWLDVARYSDGAGGFLDRQNYPDAWRFRDWVVDAFNADMPIDQFIRLQIAGDLTGDKANAVATGFFALGPDYQGDGDNSDSIAKSMSETLDDRVDTLTRGLLGITGSCAQCHDHKFDPVPQLDYYSLAGVFRNSGTHDLPLAEQEVVDRSNAHDKAIEERQQQVESLQEKIQKENRDRNDAEQAQITAWQAEIAELEANRPPGYASVHALKETGSADMPLAIRGDLRKTGEMAPRRFLRILSGPDPPTFTKGSGREELAEAIVDRKNPLTARVFVNRVWMHHFGAGLVKTPSNFGTLGETPTHPLLLDWIAADFVEHGWSLKRLHRQIMTSATYQLSSAYDADSFRQDGDNRLLWRMSPRRMEVEVWRDSLLSITGELDPTLGGPSFDNIAQERRRTIYAKVSRNGDAFASDGFLRRFDFPHMRATVAKRPQSIVPQQYLFLLNSQFMVDRAKSLVARLESVTQRDDEKIEKAYELLYGRPPSANEAAIGLEYLASSEHAGQKISAWEQYAQVLLSSNEFMFIR